MNLLGAVTGASRSEQASALLLEKISEVLPVAAGAVTLADVGRQLERTSHQVGYPTQVLSHLTSPAFLRDDYGYAILRRAGTSSARSWFDVVGYQRGNSATEVFRPAGFGGGITCRLVTRGGRHVGHIHLSTVDADPATRGMARALTLAGSLLAAALDPLRDVTALCDALAPAGARAAVIAAPGSPVAVPGRDLPDGQDLEVARRHLELRPGHASRDCQVDRFVRFTRQQQWRHLIVVSRGDQAALLIAYPAPPPPISVRELDVVTLLVGGFTNAAIGHRLGISESTVAHHVEHVGRKLGAVGRAQITARALSVGLRLP